MHTISFSHQLKSISSNSTSYKHIYRNHKDTTKHKRAKQLRILSTKNKQTFISENKTNKKLPLSTTFKQDLPTPTNTDTCKKEQSSIGTPRILEVNALFTSLSSVTFVARASRLLKTSSSTTRVKSNRKMPERSELRTASCKGFMLAIVLCRCDYEERAYSIASPAPRVYDRTVTFERAKPLGEKSLTILLFSNSAENGGLNVLYTLRL